MKERTQDQNDTTSQFLKRLRLCSATIDRLCVLYFEFCYCIIADKKDAPRESSKNTKLLVEEVLYRRFMLLVEVSSLFLPDSLNPN